MNPATSSLQAEVFERIARLAGALSAPARLRILQILAQGPRSVESLAEATQLSVANTSMHLQKLAHGGIVKVRREGVARIYEVASPAITGLWENLQDLAHDLDPWLNQAENTISDPTFRGPEDSRDVLDAIKSGKALLIDVRFEAEATATPIPQALSIPHDQFDNHIKELPKNKTLYLVCRGRYCHQANEAVEHLRKKGFKAFRLRHSPFRLRREWRTAKEGGTK